MSEIKVGDKIEVLANKEGSCPRIVENEIVLVRYIYHTTLGRQAYEVIAGNAIWNVYADEINVNWRKINSANLPGQLHMYNPPSASKNDNEKADLSLIPAVALEAAARAFMVGEKKYNRYNFYKGHKASQLVAALMRHTTAWMEGEERDPVDGQLHLGSVIACAAMILQQQKLGTLKDNRYKPEGS